MARSDAATDKKARKKARPPQTIDPATWDAVKAACIAGLGFSECARRFGIRNAHAIIMRCRRDHWPIPSRVKERARQLQASLQRRSEAAEQRRHVNNVTTEIIAQSWAEKGEAHRALTFNLAHTALIKASKQGLPIEDWASAERADKMARRSAQLDDKGHDIRVGLALIDARIQACDLPKDALPVLENASGEPDSEPLQNDNL